MSAKIVAISVISKTHHRSIGFATVNQIERIGIGLRSLFALALLDPSAKTRTLGSGDVGTFSKKIRQQNDRTGFDFREWPSIRVSSIDDAGSNTVKQSCM